MKRVCPTMRRPCIHCKSSRHASDLCPLYLKSKVFMRMKHAQLSDEFSGSSPAPFIGRFGYPNVQVGVLAPPEIRDDAWLYDAPQHWASEGFKIPQIAEFRGSMINSRSTMSVKEPDSALQIVQEVGMASKPVDLDIDLEKKPTFRFQVDAYAAPMGPSAQLKKLTLTSNPRIPGKVEKIFSDTDLRAVDGLTYLYEQGIDENALTQLLSVGTLGIEKSRRLVPTRWSITATDDTIGKHLVAEIKDEPVENTYQAYFGGYLGNYYLVLVFPDYWQYELFETYVPQQENAQYSTDYEPFNGRTNYAEQCAGGYYTVRLAIAEQLKSRKRQAAALVLRFITEEYTMPLGVWVTREATRKALASKPVSFSTKELLITYATNLIQNKFGFNAKQLFDKSILLQEVGKQQRLGMFI